MRLGVGADSLDASWVERWVSRHIIGRIPEADMILSDLLGSDALEADGRRVGGIVDVRLEISGAPAQLLAATVVTGLLVSPRTRFSTWGYERRGEERPRRHRPPAAVAASRHRSSSRGTTSSSSTSDGSLFREGYARLDPMLPQAPKED